MEEMDATKNTIHARAGFFAFCAIALILGSCEGAFFKTKKSSSSTGSIALTAFRDPAGGISRTLRPSAESLQITGYSFHLVGPDGLIVDGTDTAGIKTFDDLAIGNWTVTVSATNASFVTLLSGAAPFSITAGQITELTVNLEAPAGTGSVNLSISVPSFVAAVAGTVQAEPDGAATTIAAGKLTLASCVATYSDNLAAGTWKLSLVLKNSQGSMVGMVIEDLDIFSGISTTRAMTITAAALDQVPVAPEASTATAGDGRVSLALASILGATSYNVYYKAGSTATTADAKASGSPFVSLNPVIGGLKNGTLYAFVVTANNVVGEGPAGSAATATPIWTGGVPKSGLVAEYLFNLSAADSSGNGKDGTSSLATMANDRFGTAMQAYSYVSNGSKVSLPAMGLANGSLTLWFKSAKDKGVIAGASGGIPFIGLGNQTASYSDESICYAAGDLQMYVRNGEASYLDDAWHFLVMNVDGSHNTMYIDGAEQPVSFILGGAATSDSFFGNSAIDVGYYLGISAYKFAGTIDDIRIYDRGLGAAEVQALYEDGEWIGNPVIPKELSAAPGVERVSLVWNASMNASSYNVYFKAGSAAATTADSKADSSFISGCSATITGLAVGTQYGFVVTAVNAAGESQPSAAASAVPLPVPVSSVSLSKLTDSLIPGGMDQLEATIDPANATNKNVAWTSSNASIASVSAGGLVTGIAVGTATITVAAADHGKSATCTVMVVPGILSLAGNGAQGHSGDGGPATAASLYWPNSLALDSAGNIYFSESGNNCVRKISPTGIISTFAGSGISGFSGDGGPAASARLSAPDGVALDSNGNVYIADEDNNRIRKVDSSGIISTFAGGGSDYSEGVVATTAYMSYPKGVAVDPSGNVYFSEYGQVRRISVSGIISTYAGKPDATVRGDDGPAVAAKVYDPRGIAFDASGNLYIAEFGNDIVRKVDTSGIITTLAYVTRVIGVTVDASGNVYACSNSTIRKLGGGTSVSIAGCGFDIFRGDNGPATQAGLYWPAGLAVDQAGDILVADTGNSRIRKIFSALTPTFTLTGGLLADYVVTFALSAGTPIAAPNTSGEYPVYTIPRSSLPLIVSVSSLPAATAFSWYLDAVDLLSSTSSLQLTSSNLPAGKSNLTLLLSQGSDPNRSATIILDATN
jgi:sugar lactone lactonase YvrE